eukprot:TRINITY_DN2836_c0_g1_i1.p1 TRINITY_DN2836_c0_g1~~TRINITY_DN2836_c0_g1_i1.p1  ORF type:complete len:171 (+),score=39.45 TRINITY_DN2836_c0_g1_i1:152-664(+)
MVRGDVLFLFILLEWPPGICFTAFGERRYDDWIGSELRKAADFSDDDFDTGSSLRAGAFVNKSMKLVHESVRGGDSFRGDFDGDFDGEFTGAFSGSFRGDFRGAFRGTIHGDFYKSRGHEHGDFAGGLEGDFEGEIHGDFGGDFEGDFRGEFKGGTSGDIDDWPRHGDGL